MNNTQAIIAAVVVLAAFLWLWKAGHLLRIRLYVHETREELRRCNWPSWVELRGSTAVVIISVALIGVFTILVDLLLVQLVRNYLLKL